MQLRTVENTTGFRHIAFCKLGANNEFCDVVVVKANLRLANGALEVIDEPAEIILADDIENHQSPELSLIRRAGDAVVYKPGTDVILTGKAIAPKECAHREWACEFKLHTQNGVRSKRLHLLGPRYWEWSLVRGWHLSDPELVEFLPVSYALAYGGHDSTTHQTFEMNPSGRGWFGQMELKRGERYPAPQIQYIETPLLHRDKPIPVAGFGPIARWWGDRYRYAGTYDAVWRRAFDSSPHSIYPTDFDERFFQCANPDWIFEPYLKGDESFSLVGFLPNESMTCTLPGLMLAGACVTKSGTLIHAQLPLDTVHVDIDARIVSLVWRATLPQSLGVSFLALHGARMPYEPKP